MTGRPPRLRPLLPLLWVLSACVLWATGAVRVDAAAAGSSLPARPPPSTAPGGAAAQQGAVDAYRREVGVALQALERGEPERATAAARRALELRPGDPTALGLLGVGLLQSGDTVEAVDVLSRAASDAPRDGFVLYHLGLAQRAAGDPEAAAATLGRVLELRDDVAVRYALARTLMDAGRAGEAAEHLAVLAEREPADPNVRLGLAEARLVLGEHAAAAQAARQAIERAPEALAPRVVEVRALLGAGRAERALERLEEHVAALEAGGLEPGAAEASTPLAGAALAVGAALEPVDAGVAAGAYELAVRSGAGWRGWLGRGRALRASGRFAEAIAALRRAIEARPGFAAIRYELGQALLRHGDRDAALAEFEAAVEMDPAHAAARYQLGRLYTAVGRADDGERQLERFRELAAAVASRSPHRVDAREGRAVTLNRQGLAHLRGGEHAAAAERFRAALQEAPGRAEIWVNLGLALYHLGELEGSVRAVRRGIELSPGEAGFWRLLARIETAAGSPDRAAEASARADRLEEQDRERRRGR